MTDVFVSPVNWLRAKWLEIQLQYVSVLNLCMYVKLYLNALAWKHLYILLMQLISTRGVTQLLKYLEYKYRIVYKNIN